MVSIRSAAKGMNIDSTMLAGKGLFTRNEGHNIVSVHEGTSQK